MSFGASEGGFDPPTLEQVRRWVETARPGSSIVYGRGITAAQAADPLAAEWLLRQAQRGYVSLVQRRVAPCGSRMPFEYIAQRVAKRWDPAEPVVTPPARTGNIVPPVAIGVALKRQMAEAFA